MLHSSPRRFSTGVPVSAKRRRSRGYDQTELLAHAVARELELPCTQTLQKIRHNPAQSSQRDAAARRANVLGAYRAVSPERFAGRSVLLIDDILTTGATLSECSRVLLTAGAKGKRSALPHSRVMIHQPLGGAQGQASDIEITARQILRTKKELYEILSAHSGAKLSKIEKDADRDYWMTAPEAKEYGLIDEVLAGRKKK